MSLLLLMYIQGSRRKRDGADISFIKQKKLKEKKSVSRKAVDEDKESSNTQATGGASSSLA